MNYDFNSTDGLFDRMLRKQQRTVPQRQRPETHPAMPRFQGRELPLDVQLRAVAARDRRIAELNRPQPAPGLLAKAVTAVVGAAVAAVAAFSPGKPRERAAQFLRDVLANGAVVPALEVERLAKEAGISGRTLCRAKAIVGIKHVRNADLSWSWRFEGQKAMAG
jgi:hypothetical protein